jgi:hypothetical protein
MRGLLAWAAGILLTNDGLRMPLTALLLPILGGILLWFLAKPLAALITNDLG